MTAAPLLEIEGLTKVFGPRRRLVAGAQTGFLAVDGISFSVGAGETFGIVGESGSGKSTTARMLLRLVAASGGSVRFEGEDLFALGAEALRRQRRGMQMVFQDPFSSLNPRMRIGRQIAEPMLLHGLATKANVGTRVAGIMARVGLDPDRASAFPHEFSGGQRQRIAIGRALAAEPRLLVADEAVSALDVSVRAQILNLLDDLKRQSNLAMVFISHDLGVVRYLADRIAVMYRGRIIEIGPTAEVFATPRHPYTRALLSAIPVARAGVRRVRPAEPTAPDAPSDGCAYAGRCPLATARCWRDVPVLEARAHASACFRAAEVAPPEIPAPEGASPSADRLRRLQERFLSAAETGDLARETVGGIG